ncbi:MAG: hypothetical protein IJA32_07510 [Lachnospiraceae bacterium]|nr:hypothetical protein [Lachnospiraceae bacterium]
MNCRGPQKREEIVRDYQLECVAHIRLVNGTTIRSDAERDITRTYYMFLCTNRENPEIVEQICCGEGAGKELLRLADITAPAIFNMLHEEHNGGHGGGEGGGRVENHEVWNESAKQLYDAIMILITAWNMKPGPIYNYLKEAKLYRYCVPYSYRVERINEILHRNNTSMRAVLNTLAQRNPNLREYRFNLLEDILHEADIVSYFEDANGH